MSRRGPYYSTLVCSSEGCNERVHYQYRTLAEQRDGHQNRKGKAWFCTRHNEPEKVLTPDNLVREVVMVATPGDNQYIADKLFWTGVKGELTSGFQFGPGFKAYAKDFPEGTRLVITARIEMPE